MRRYQKIFPALTFVTTFVLIGTTLIEPMVAHGQSKAKMRLSKERELNHLWGRNPFLLPSGVRLSSKSDSALVTKKTASKTEANASRISPHLLKVKAILISDHIRLATIGHHIVTVGDVINDEKILEIKTDRVILGKGGKKRTIHLYQSPIPLTVEEKE